jgi:hypothetical protein
MESRPVLEGRDCLMSSGETEVALRVSGLVVSLTAIYEEIMETFLNKVPEGYEPKELVQSAAKTVTKRAALIRVARAGIRPPNSKPRCERKCAKGRSRNEEPTSWRAGSADNRTRRWSVS